MIILVISKVQFIIGQWKKIFIHLTGRLRKWEIERERKRERLREREREREWERKSKSLSHFLSWKNTNKKILLLRTSVTIEHKSFFVP